MRFAAAVVFLDDVPAALDFYERAFGFKRKFYDPEYGFGELETGDATFAFATHACAEFVMRGAYERIDRPGAVEIAFTTTNVEAAFERAIQAGATSVTEQWSPPFGGTISYVRTPEGTLVGIVTAPGE